MSNTQKVLIYLAHQKYINFTHVHQEHTLHICLARLKYLDYKAILWGIFEWIIPVVSKNPSTNRFHPLIIVMVGSIWFFYLHVAIGSFSLCLMASLSRWLSLWCKLLFLVSIIIFYVTNYYIMFGCKIQYIVNSITYLRTYIYTCTCMHTYIHTYIHTQTHAHIHTYIHTYVCAFPDANGW